MKDKVIVGTSGGDDGVRGFVCRVRCTDRKASLAILDDSRAGRAWLGKLAGADVFARRRHDLDARNVRS